MKLTIAMPSAFRPGLSRDRAVKALRAGGFLDPLHLFTEPPHPEQHWLNVTVHPNETQLGGWLNHKQCLRWLLDNAPTRYLMVAEDDVVFCCGARQLLDQQIEAHPDFSVITLYYSNRDHQATKAADGWFLHNRGCHHFGNLALVFDREGGIEKYLASVEHIVEGRFTRNYDVPMFSWFKNNPSEDHGVWSHCPSLVDHIGVRSTLGHKDHPGRRGYRFPK